MNGVVENGYLLRVWGTRRDITAQKRAEAALRESEERLRETADRLRRGYEDRAYLAAIVESSDDAIISKDLNGIVRSCNAAAERMFGYSAAELVGQPIRLLIPADRQAEEDEILGRIRSGERSRSLPDRAPRQGRTAGGRVAHRVAGARRHRAA